MWETESTVEIGRPPETVYTYLADFTRHPEWSTGVSELVPVTDGPLATGMELQAVETVPARFTSRTRITALEPGRRIAWESWDGRTTRVNWSFELRPGNNGSTHLVQRARFQSTSLLGRVLLKLMRKRQIPGENAQSLAQIKANLEQHAAM
jgi:uncharacterized membrane protein